MKEQDVPAPGELTAHVRTATDAAIRWLDRALAAGPGNVDAWDHATFYTRMILMRGLERGELLGWSLAKDGAAARTQERREATRAGAAYWGEARDALDGSLRSLRRLADVEPSFARGDVQDARDRLVEAKEWLTSLAEALAATDERVIELDQRSRTQLSVVELDLERL